MAESAHGLHRALPPKDLHRLVHGLSRACRRPVLVEDDAGRPVAQARPDGGPDLPDPAGQPPAGTLRFPIRKNGKAFGSIVIDRGAADNGDTSSNGNPGLEGISDLAGALADMMADRCLKYQETRSLTRELSLRYEELNLLYEIGQNLTVARNASHGIQIILDKFRQILNADFVVLTDPSARIRGFSSEESVTSRVGGLTADIRGMAAVATQMVIEQGEAVVIKDVTQSGPLAAFATGRASILTALVDIQDPSLGCVTALRRPNMPPFESTHVKMLIILAAELALVLKNSELFENLQSLFINIIRTLIFAIEGKDQYTRGHSERVNKFSMHIGRELGLDAEELRTLHNASLLHDIGKIYVPERILCKPDKLTPEEFDVIKTHPARGAQMLEPIAPLRDALPGVRHHHEKLDGSGYPDGIAGEEITRIPRIIAVADIFDAMTSDRAYRPGMTIQQTKHIMSGMKVKLLDGEIAGIFLDRCEEYARSVESELASRGLGVQL